MDAELHADLNPDEYDAFVDRLAAEADDAPADRSRSDAAWDAVDDIVPQLTGPVCDRLLDLTDSEPDAVLVAQVTQERDSDDAERRRAEALTALVRDVEAQLEDEAEDA